MSGKDIKCCVCQKQFSAVFNLAKHARKYHSVDIIPKKSYKYQCLQCNKHFSLLKNFNYHKKTHNQSHNPPSKNTYDAVCPICQLKAPKDNLILHFKVEHDIKCETLAIEFTTFEEFSKWKSDMEHDTKSKYVAERGSQGAKDGTTIIKYCCHRSGKYVARGKGLRHLKTQGSNKIDGFCPARLKVIIDKNNQCKVSFIKQHVGHDEEDLGHLFLTLQERKCLANKMAEDERNLLISEDPKASEVSGIVTGLTVNEALHPKEFDKQFIAKERQTCMEQLEAAKNMCIALEPTLQAIATKRELTTPSTRASPSNKKLTPQRGVLHSTKKKNKRPSMTLVAPTNEEMQAIAIRTLSK
nr:PREDICTED: uncharacterized protein LOC103312814 isoform X2 [Tribolium castaneum]|eukprot:XP_008192627.1 PREDICTED: uncharacterized protein LOC103312814 isoform X2 [Tribolium castaneum]